MLTLAKMLKCDSLVPPLKNFFKISLISFNIDNIDGCLLYIFFNMYEPVGEGSLQTESQ